MIEMTPEGKLLLRLWDPIPTSCHSPRNGKVFVHTQIQPTHFIHIAHSLCFKLLNKMSTLKNWKTSNKKILISNNNKKH